MSVELQWLDLSALSSNLVELLNKQLSSTTRPSFIGPVNVVSLDFGTIPPDVEVVDVRDIYRDFLDNPDDENSDDGSAFNGDTAGAKLGEDDDEFEWISRKSTNRPMEEGLAYHHLPPHVRYGRGPASASNEFFAASSNRSPWSRTLPNIGDLRHHQTASPPPPEPEFSPPAPRTPLPSAATSHRRTIPPPNPETDLQIHLRISHHSDMRMTLTTSLLINYPSPLFMELPIKLSVTGLVFNGELVVAYQASRSRAHLCILDDLDPYRPASGLASLSASRDFGRAGDFMASQSSLHESPPRVTLQHEKRIPVGLRLLPNIMIESEIGQADKHVLKNVTRVERFIQDVIRKTVEEELVFPNYHTMLFGE